MQLCRYSGKSLSLTCSTWLQWLEIKPTDSEKNKAKKKKLQKSYKSKLRFHKLDMETKNRQDSWLNFRKGKGAKKKVLLRSPPYFLLLSMKFWQSHEEQRRIWQQMFIRQAVYQLMRLTIQQC